MLNQIIAVIFLVFFSTIQGAPPGETQVAELNNNNHLNPANEQQQTSKFRQFARGTGGFVKGVLKAPFYSVGRIGSAIYDFAPSRYNYYDLYPTSRDFGSGVLNIGRAIASPFYYPYKEAHNAFYKDQIRSGDKMYLGSLHHDSESNANRQQLFKIIYNAGLDSRLAKRYRSMLKDKNVDYSTVKIYEKNLQAVSDLNNQIKQVTDPNKRQALATKLGALKPVSKIDLVSSDGFKAIQDELNSAGVGSQGKPFDPRSSSLPENRQSGLKSPLAPPLDRETSKEPSDQSSTDPTKPGNTPVKRSPINPDIAKLPTTNPKVEADKKRVDKVMKELEELKGKDEASYDHLMSVLKSLEPGSESFSANLKSVGNIINETKGKLSEKTKLKTSLDEMVRSNHYDWVPEFQDRLERLKPTDIFFNQKLFALQKDIYMAKSNTKKISDLRQVLSTLDKEDQAKYGKQLASIKPNSAEANRALIDLEMEISEVKASGGSKQRDAKRLIDFKGKVQKLEEMDVDKNIVPQVTEALKKLKPGSKEFPREFQKIQDSMKVAEEITVKKGLIHYHMAAGGKWMAEFLDRLNNLRLYDDPNFTEKFRTINSDLRHATQVDEQRATLANQYEKLVKQGKIDENQGFQKGLTDFNPASKNAQNDLNSMEEELLKERAKKLLEKWNQAFSHGPVRKEVQELRNQLERFDPQYLSEFYLNKLEAEFYTLSKDQNQ